MRNLFIRAVRDLEPTWHDRYKDICDKVSAVHDWRDSNDASDDLVKRVIYDTSNGRIFCWSSVYDMAGTATRSRSIPRYACTP